MTTDTLELNLDDAVDIAVDIAHEAGRLTLDAFRTVQEVRSKQTDVDLVTQTDIDSESLISTRLGSHFPTHGFLFEEGTEKDCAESGARWIVDPLDGTVNFAHGHPFFCISIALQHKEELVIGVIHAPVLGVTWTARRGGGAFRNKAPAQVTPTPTLDAVLCASGFPYDRRTSADNNTAEWSAVIRHAQGVRRCGSAALDLAMIADGTFGGFWEKRLNPWDIAAGVLIIEEAGGKVTDLSGGPVPPWPNTIVASNGLVQDELLRVLQEVDKP